MTAPRTIPHPRASPRPLQVAHCALHTLEHAHSCTLLDVIDALVVAVDREGRVVLFNKACESATGFSADELTGKEGIRVLVPPELQGHVRRLIDDLFAGGENSRSCNEWMTRDGGRRLISWSNTRITDPDGTVRYVIGTGIDLTHQRDAEKALRESEQRFRLLVESVTDYAIFTVNPEGVIQTWNSGAQRLYGYSAEEILGRSVLLLIPPEQRDDGQLAAQLRQGIRRQELEGWRVCKDGRRIWAHVIRTPMFDENGNLYGITAVTRDITERRELERLVIEAAVEEQRRIGQDLHDGVCQELTGVAFACQALINDLDEIAPRQADRLRKIADLVDHAFGQTRALSHGLHPVSVEPNGLGIALRRLANQVQEISGVACEVADRHEVQIADAAAATHLYRIAQEAVNNALRHGKPRHLKICLCRNRDEARLSVSDDGRGIGPDNPSDAAPERGTGLSIMRYRANLIGAILTVTSEPGCGARVVCSFPCKETP